MDPDKPLPPSNAAGSVGGPIVPPLASKPPDGPAGASPAASVVAPSVTKFGGNPTGRKLTKFKHPPETPEGIKERRKADAARKSEKREEAARVVEPPPLPSAGARSPGETSAPGSPLALGAGCGFPPVEAPPVLWQPEMLQTIVGKLLEAAEEGRVGSFLAKCEEAGLMPKLIKDIEGDAHFPDAAKALLKDSLPRLACKWLNKFGISAEFRDELACVTAILLIVKNDKSTSARLDELIALKKAEEKKLKAADAEPVGLERAA